MRKSIVCILLFLSFVSSARGSDSLRWREVFVDPLLSALIDTALVHNTDLRKASLQVEQADATLRMARLSLLPTLSLAGEGAFTKERGATATSKFSLPVRLQWEVGLPNRFVADRQVAENRFWSAAETERAVKLQVVCAVASQYYTLRMLDEQLVITREGVENAERTVQVMEALKEAGMQNEAGVAQARTAALSAEASEKTLLQQIRITESALMQLLGHQMDSIVRRSSTPIQVPMEQTGTYPLQSLSERPDVKAAEYALAASLARVDVARSAFYPTLGVTASVNWLDMLSDAIASLTQPLFNAGRNRGNLRIAKAEYEEALSNFSQTLLVAGTELRDALSACTFSAERIALREQEVTAAMKAYESSEALMQSGSATYLEVLTAQAALLQSRLSLAADRLDLVQGRINLYKALGGNENQTVCSS